VFLPIQHQQASPALASEIATLEALVKDDPSLAKVLGEVNTIAVKKIVNIIENF
jgi:hypothetical protein